MKKKFNAKKNFLSMFSNKAYFTYEFNPICESVARFLNNKDCASVDKLNIEYHTKTWMIVLNCIARVNQWISVEDKSWLWIYKYRQHLRYQKLTLSNNLRFFTLSNSLRFFALEIPKLDSLHILCSKNEFIQIPKQIRELIICGHDGVVLPILDGITSFSWLSRPGNNLNLQSLPLSLIQLNVRSSRFNVVNLPILPNMTILTLNNCDMLQMDQLRTKCPNIQTLNLKDTCSDFGTIDLIVIKGLQINTLSLDCSSLMNIHSLQFVKVNHLIFLGVVSKDPVLKRCNLSHIKDVQFHGCDHL
jgi:hypothetical protein